MALPSPLPDELVELISRQFRLLADPTRVRLFDRLRDGEATVQELAAEPGTSQQDASKHLTLLAESGVVARRKEGNSDYYRIADDDVIDLCDRVSGSVERHLLGLAQLLEGTARTNPERTIR